MNISNDIERVIKQFSRHGETAEGGITRLLYQPEWLCFQKEVASLMEEVGMQAGFDGAGNMIGRIEGTRYPEPVVAGSHADTVKNGGRLDGQLGIAAGCMAVRQLLKRYGPPQRSLEVVAFAEEEGSRYPYTFWGSRNYLGLVTTEPVKGLLDEDGVPFLEAMRSAGFPPFAGTLNGRSPACYVELHVEQGDVLESSGLRLGVVTGIAAQRRYNIQLDGMSNHAGTTGMKTRRDAMMGFARICERTLEKAHQVNDTLVVTFGKVLVEPNITNVIPGKVRFSVDCRHETDAGLRQFTEAMLTDMRECARQLGLDIHCHIETDVAAVQMDPAMVDLLEGICIDNQIAYRKMHSGAGHDAQILAPHVPSAMIFVPSMGGISHNPQEYTRPEDLALGVEVLAEALYRLAWRE